MLRPIVTLLLICLICVLIPGTAVAQEPAWPDKPSQASIIFDSAGPDGSIGVWIWDNMNFVSGDQGPTFWAPRWQWHPLDKSLMSDIQLAGKPEWPTDLMQVRVLSGSETPASELGLWVWNPYQFVQCSEGPTLWSPTWVWVRQGDAVRLW